MRLGCEDLHVAIDGHPILAEVALTVEPGAIVGVVGPNGSGKSTLLRTCFRVLHPVAGAVWLGDERLHQLPAREVARRMAVVLQERPSDFDFRVADVVMMGRAPHKRPLDRESAEDRRIVAEALSRVGADHLGGRTFGSLSGGEKQRVLIARALAQRARVLLLDEPTNHLDVRYQLEVMELVAGLGVTVLAAIHDLNLAAAYCDRLYVLAGGRVHAVGTPRQVLTPTLIREVFGVGAVVREHPVTGLPELSFYPLGVAATAGAT